MDSNSIKDPEMVAGEVAAVETFNSQITKRIEWKTDYTFLPILSLAYLLKYVSCVCYIPLSLFLTCHQLS
jgi:hypothetical protein